MDKILNKYFDGFGKVFFKNLPQVVEGVMRSGSSSVAEIARSASKKNRQSFKTNEKRINRLLQNENFQVSDKMWRKYLNVSFDLLTERELIKAGDNILIRVDFTSNEDEFLILAASADFGGRSVPLYFSMRAYPKRKGQSAQKKMEEAFMKELRHLLPKKYTYAIVADRGFGNDRFSKLCVDNGFDYALRINENLNIQIGDNRLNLKDFSKGNEKFKARVEAWNKDVNFEVKTENKSTWFLFSSLSLEKSFSEIYQKRFAIEKCFQDQKSSGFDIEKTKIRKYDRMKRLYFTMCLAQLFAVAVGEYVENKKHPLKKTFPILTDILSAFSSLDGISAKSTFAKQLD